jgi:hypothetical protein
MISYEISIIYSYKVSFQAFLESKVYVEKMKRVLNSERSGEGPIANPACKACTLYPSKIDGGIDEMEMCLP